jgi:HEAT repeat protein
MKHFTRILSLMVFLLVFSNTTFAGDGISEPGMNESTIASLLEGLASDNLGLKSSCAYMLGELKVTEAIIPLMKMLHNDVNEEIRISAALALYKIGTPMSIHAVKQAVRFDESERVNKLAHNFYSEYLREKLNNTVAAATDSLIAQGK